MCNVNASDTYFTALISHYFTKPAFRIELVRIGIVLRIVMESSDRDKHHRTLVNGKLQPITIIDHVVAYAQAIGGWCRRPHAKPLGNDHIHVAHAVHRVISKWASCKRLARFQDLLVQLILHIPVDG
uniref:Uncharacterized protein n=1 Tax=Anopheles farauti TaxID=69004 RepID=A0A182Q054_9DIPT